MVNDELLNLNVKNTNSMIKSIKSLSNQYFLDLKSKKVKTTTFFRIFLLFGLLFSLQCVIAQPTITSFAPLSGKVGDTITILGNSFNTTAANNIVFFGATRATVSTATSTSLTVTVPIGATFAPITLLNTATGLATYSTQFFNPVFSPSKGSITLNDISPKVNFTVGWAPKTVSIGDIDGDGKPDLAIANEYDNTISVLRNTGNNGTVSFALKVDFATGSNPKIVAIGDINGDGKPDLVTNNVSNNSVSVLRNTSSSGTISFATKVDFTTGGNPQSVTIGDLDGDGKPDLAIASWSSNTISVLRNTGSSGTISFATRVNFTTGSGPYSLTIGDIDGDGKPDLAVVNRDNNTISVLRNTSSSGIMNFATKVDFTTGSSPYQLAIGDIDGDGKLDLTTANIDSDSVSVLRNTSSSGTVSFATKVDFTTGTNSEPFALAIGDIDGDGKPDLAVATSGYNTIAVLRNISSSGTVSFGAKVDFGTSLSPSFISIGDIDGDSKPDLLITNNGINGTVSVLRNNPQPPPSPPTITSFAPSSCAIGATFSITGTGFNTTPANNVVFFGATRATVITASATSLTVIVPIGANFAPITVLNTLTALVAYSTQFFKPIFSPTKGSITSTDLAAKVDFATNSATKSVAVGDIDGDGKTDLAIVNGGNNTVSVLRNTGSSGLVNFATKVDFTTGINPWSVAIGDIDGDSKPDMVIANYNSNTVSILRNTASIGVLSFALKVDFTSGIHPKSVTIGDIDGDGKPDLVIANDSSNSVSVLRNTGSSGFINFAPKVDFATGSFPSSVAIGDIDGDEKPDLAIPNDSSNTVSVLRNISISGTVSFAIKVDFGTGTQPTSLALGDINGDGRLDLAIANRSSNTISVLRNISTSGVLSFAPKVDFATGSSPRFVAIGDMDGDGKSDLAITNQGSNTISILRNTSNNATVSFTTKVDFITNTQPNTLAIGDIDGDGKPDLAIENGGNTVSLYRNNPQIFPPSITSFAPLSGTVGSSVTIIGSGFNTTPANNIIFFGATRATVTTSTTNSLTVTVPTGATFAPITLIDTGVNFTVHSPQFFNPIFSPSKAIITTSDIAAKLDFSTGTSPRSIAIGDIDGDGKSDLAIANTNSKTVSIYRNTGKIDTVNFATKVDFTTLWSPLSVAIGDIDGDGKADLVIANAGSDIVSIFRNTSSSGIINFASKVDFITGSLPYSVVIGDINGDGKPDLALTNYNSNTVSVLRNTGLKGSISFATKVDFATGSNPCSVAIGDIDGDGKPDLAIANTGNIYTVSVLRNTGSNNSVNFATKTDFTTGSNSKSIEIGDIDGDGKPDLAIGSNSVSILRNTSSSGSISFATRVDFASVSTPYSLKIGDINGDGKPDLAIINQSSNKLSILRNTSISGTVDFATKVDFASGTNPLSIAIGDIDGDGKSDLAIANENNNSVSILRNYPQPPPPTINSFTPTSAVVGASISITGVGFNTVPTKNIVFFGATKAIVTAATDTSLMVLVPIGASFAPITILNTANTLSAYSTQFFNPIYSPSKGSITTNDITTKQDFTTGPQSRAVAIGDLDGDGKPDLAVVNNVGATVSILRNTGSIGSVSFATKVDFSTGTDPESISIGDINGDGKPDLVVTNFGSSTVSVFRNISMNGAISFATKIDFATGTNPSSVAIGDIDKDGKPDLIVTNYNNGFNSISVFRNTSNSGTISFDLKVDFETGGNPASVAIGDIDGDNKPDLAIANQMSNTVSILRNTSIYGTVSFATKLDITMISEPFSIAIADLDGDGKSDLAIANVSSIGKSVSVLRNTSSIGSVSFASRVNFSANGDPYSVSAGDLDGDGKPDLAIASFSSSVSVLRNTSVSGTINFATRVPFTTGSFPRSVALGDIDCDGKLDLVASNSNSQTVSVLRNNPQFPPTISTIGNLTPFISCTGSASAQQTFTVTGTNLIANLMVIPPIGFEISTTSGSGFGNSVSLSPSSGTINAILYIRLTNSVTGSPSGNIVCASTIADTQNVAVYGLVKATSTSTTNISVCSSTLPFTWNSRAYNSSRTDTVYLTNFVGCDSITILKLTVKPTSSSTSNISICPSALPYTWNGRTYNSNSIDTVYLTNSVGCDSITILKLTVKPTSSSTSNISICPSALPYTWNGRTYNSNSIDTVYLTNSVGCDSITILKLTIKPISTSTNNISICPSALPYTWNGLIFNESGTQTKTGLTNSVGCDSSATLNLSVNPIPATSNITGFTNVARLDTATYSVIGTSGSVFNWATTKGLVQTGAGTNQIKVKWNTAGMDTLKVTETSNQGCVGSQKTLLVNIGPATGMNEINASNNILVYPNPFNETIFISLLNNSGLNKAILYDLLGKEVLTTHKSEIDVKELKSGVYLIMVIDNNGNSYSQKLIKN